MSMLPFFRSDRKLNIFFDNKWEEEESRERRNKLDKRFF